MKYESNREDPGEYLNQAMKELYSIIEDICPAGKEGEVRSRLDTVEKLIQKYNKTIENEEKRLEILDRKD